MALHLYADVSLNTQFSEGNMSEPDFALVDGEMDDYNHKQLFLANEQTSLAAGVTELDTEIPLLSPRFHDGEAVVVDNEQMLVVSGGGTNTLIVQRGYNETPPTVHAQGVLIYSGYDYFLMGAIGLDMSEYPPVASTWVSVALTEEALQTVEPGMTVPWMVNGQPTFKKFNETVSFWRRVRCPLGTPVQFVRNIKLMVLGIEIPIMDSPPNG